MKVLAASGNTAARPGSIIPEISHKNRLFRTIFPYSFPEHSSLLRSGHKVNYRFFADGNIDEVPAERAMLGNQIINEFLTTDQLCILAGYRNGKSLHNPCLIKVFSGLLNFFPDTLSPSLISLFLKTFYTNSRGHVSDFSQSLNFLIVKKSSVGINLKKHILVFLE